MEQNVELHGFVAAGENCIFKKGCRVENCIIWDNGIVEEGASLENSIVGEGWVVDAL